MEPHLGENENAAILYYVTTSSVEVVQFILQ